MTKRQLIIHPFLFALFPACHLLGTFHQYLELSMAVRPALICLAAVCLAWGALAALVRDRKRSATIVSLLTLSFFSHQAVSETAAMVIAGKSLEGIASAHLIIVCCFLAAVVGGAACWKFRDNLDRLTYLLNVIATILVVSPLASMGIQQLLTGGVKARPSTLPGFDVILQQPLEATAERDIYYLILDGYGRTDYLREEYGFDNSAFIDYLRGRGFYVAENSHSNYPQTVLSIASSLNFAYLDEALGVELRNVPERNFARQLVRQSRAVRILKKAGYSVVAFASEFYDAEIGDPDVYITEWWFKSLFETGVINMTPLPALTARLDSDLLYKQHRERILYSLDRLESMPALDGPKFVYAHIFVGHPPFVFGPQGEEVNADRPYSWAEGEKFRARPGATVQEYREAYRSQVAFLNQRLRKVIDRILEKSTPPPILIVQGDHGPGSRLDTTSLDNTDVRERFSILNAYHMPDRVRASDQLYPSISPVNSFRVLFNSYLGTNLPLLEDKSFFSPFDMPYQFSLVKPNALVGQHKRGEVAPTTWAK